MKRSRGEISSLLLLMILPLTIMLTACGGGEVDEVDKGTLTTAGYEEETAAELSRLSLNEEELAQLEIAKRGGLDGTVAVEIVKMMHDDDLKFDIGMEMQTLSGAGFSGTALVALVKMGAVRQWEADLRVMKHAGIGEPTILRIAERKFVDKKEDVLAGRDYQSLKALGVSDAGIEAFVNGGGDVQKLQQVQQAIQFGKSEPAALNEAGL
ncbi:MAG: hypothetical protein AB7H80_13775 [Candidatus Kapaibacterium sp.]